MKTSKVLGCALGAALWCGMMGCSVAVAQQKTVTETVFDRVANEDNFAFGADISWLSQQESWGTYYCDQTGKRVDLMKILKGNFGVNAVRFRVWVNPSGGWSGKQDVINLCKRADALGLKIMISFHYSDTWADSGSQAIPGQWTDHSVEALAKNVYDHTYDVLKSLYDLDIHPRWVAIGNETKYGMLYDVGKTKSTEGYKNFAKFVNSGYRAIQDVDPSMLAVIHLPNAHDEGSARSMFDNLNKYGAKYDVIGMSAYPRWSHLDVSSDANIATTVNKYMTTFKNLKARFKKPVMVVETGHYVDRPLEGNRFLSEFMKALIADGELGCFYWEPEAMENSGYNLGAWNSKTHQATIAMDAFQGLKHTVVSKYATTRVVLPDDATVHGTDEAVKLEVYAKTSTKATGVEKVEFFLNNRKVASVEEPERTNYYVHVAEALPTGAHLFYAKTYDTQGHVEMSDSISFLVGNVRIFQEQAEGFVGCEEMEETFATRIKGYTGDGYIPATAKKESAVSWVAHFPEAGDYVVVLRYQTEAARSVKFFVDDAYKYMKCAASPAGKWAYVSQKLTVGEGGVHTLKLAGSTSKGLPAIDFMGIASPEGVLQVEYGAADEVSAVGHVPASVKTGVGLDDADIYDLSGRVVSKGGKTSTLCPGIYLIGGQKVLIK